MEARSADPTRHWRGRLSWLGDDHGNRGGNIVSARSRGWPSSSDERKHQHTCIPHEIWSFWLHPRVHLVHGVLWGLRYQYRNLDPLSRLRRLASAFLTPGRGSSPIAAREFGCRILDDTGDITQAAASDGSVCCWIVNTFLPNAGALTMMAWRGRDEQKLYKPRAPNFDRARYAIPGAKVPGWYRFFWVQLAEDRLETARLGRYILTHSDMSKNQQRIWVVFHHQGGSVDCSNPASVSRQ